MKTPKPNPNEVQLTIFDLLARQENTPDVLPVLNPEDKTHPQIVAERWNFPLDIIDPDGDPKHYLYHVQQWVQGLGGKQRNVWLWLKKELFSSKNRLPLEELPYTAPNGKTYFVEYTTQEGCYAIAQAMRVTAKRPQLAEVKDYLAKAGVFADNVRRGDKDTLEWIASRSEGVTARKTSTQSYVDTHVTHSPNIGVLTNVTYHALFETRKQETAKKEIVKQLGLTATQAANLRDHLHILAIQAIKSAETLASEKMRLSGRQLNDDEQIEIVRHASEMEARSYLDKCQWLGIDPITGLKSKTSQYDWEV